MKAIEITFEVTNLTLKQGDLFFTYKDLNFDKAYSKLKKELKSYDFIIENVKFKY